MTQQQQRWGGRRGATAAEKSIATCSQLGYAGELLQGERVPEAMNLIYKLVRGSSKRRLGMVGGGDAMERCRRCRRRS